MNTQNQQLVSTAPSNISVGLTDSQSFELAQRVAKCFSASSLVPKDYQNNLPNCVIALNMAHRMGADPMMIMQNLVVIHGRPSWSAQFLIATFNKNGAFSSIRYEFFGTEGQDDWGCRAKATELSTGEMLIGPLVTVGIAKKEGWFQKSGSKWQTMPEQMLRYRAASWFVRTVAPEIAMGLQTAEEIHDTYDLDRQGETYLMPVRGQSSSDLNAMLYAEAPTVEPEVMPEPAQESPAPSENLAPTPELATGPRRTRPTPEELDGMRVDLVQEIAAEGLPLKAVEDAVKAYSNQWSAVQMEKIRTIIIPNLKADKAGM